MHPLLTWAALCPVPWYPSGFVSFRLNEYFQVHHPFCDSSPLLGCQAPSIERPYRKLYHVFSLLGPGLKELGTQCQQVNNLPLSVSSLLPEGLGRMYPEEEYFALTTYFFLRLKICAG